jgi:hypothetical protein
VLLDQMATRVDAQDWDGLAALLALRARVRDATGESPESHVVASFGTARQGLLVELVEVWAEVVDPAGLRR